MKEKPDFGGRGCLGQNSLFLNVHILCCSRKQVGGGATALWNSDMQDLSLWPQAFSDEHSRISPKYKQGSDEKEDPFLVNFSPLVCFHQYFQFMIQKTLKLATLTIRL